MTFWNWRRGAAVGASAGSAAVALAPELAPIELYTADARIVGWIAANGRRVTDLLNEQDELRLWRPMPGPLTNESQLMPLPGVEATEEWESLLTETMILAMPPEWRASRQLRLHKRLRRVAISAGPFQVTGNLHLHPGTEVTHHLVTRGQRFLPLTDAYILHSGDPPFEHVVSVVIVNTAHVTSLTSLVTLA